MTAPDHAGCAEHLHHVCRNEGLDVTVSTQPPLVQGPYTLDPFICPHGVPHWIEPTGEQIAQWAKDELP